MDVVIGAKNFWKRQISARKNHVTDRNERSDW